MAPQPKPITQLTDEAITLLVRNLGTAETLRFLSEISSAQGNYTEDRKALFGKLSLEEIVAEIRVTSPTPNTDWERNK